MTPLLFPAKKQKKPASLFFGMKISRSQREKIDVLAERLNVSRSKAVLSLIENINVENIPQNVPQFNALELSKLPKKQRQRIMKMQVESGIAHFEIVEDEQELIDL